MSLRHPVFCSSPHVLMFSIENFDYCKMYTNIHSFFFFLVLCMQLIFVPAHCNGRSSSSCNLCFRISNMLMFENFVLIPLPVLRPRRCEDVMFESNV